MKLFWFDSETTGLNYKEHQMLSFACVVTDLQLNILNEIYVKMKLLPNIKPTEEALSVNKLDPYTLFWEAESISETQFCDDLNQFYEENKSDKNHWVAYNSKFDCNFVRNAFDRSNKKFNAISDVVFDPLIMCRKAVELKKIITIEKYNKKEGKSYLSSTLVDVSNALGTSHEGEAHNALVDTKCMIKTVPKAYSRLVGHEDFSQFFNDKSYASDFLEKVYVKKT